VPADRVPQVRVTDELAPPPHRQTTRRASASPVLARDSADALASIATVPCRRTGPGVYTIAELEDLLRQKSSRSQHVEPWVAAESLALVGAEDGSDRHTWVLPRQRLELGANSPATCCERLVRAVLSQWDFRDQEGWRPWLVQAFRAAPE